MKKLTRTLDDDQYFMDLPDLESKMISLKLS